MLSMQACSVRATALDQPNVLKNMKNTFLEALKHVGAQADDGEVTLSKTAMTSLALRGSGGEDDTSWCEADHEAVRQLVRGSMSAVDPAAAFMQRAHT